MNQSLENFKNDFNDSLLNLLWSHWSALGISGYGGKISQMLDPEALILMTASIGRYDPRMFDAMIEWLVGNERIINIARLKSILIKESFNAENVIPAIAKVVSETGNKTKWKQLSAKRISDKTDYLFLNSSNQFYVKEPDPVFESYGLVRPKFEKRNLITPFSVNDRSTLLLRLRSFFGVSARSEIIAFLMNRPNGVAREIAQYSYYFLRTVQDTLSEITASGVVLAQTVIGKKRELQYSLSGNELGKMFFFERSEDFVCWGALYSALEKIFLLINNDDFQNYSELLQNSELRKITRENLSDRINRSRIKAIIPDGSKYPGTQYMEVFYSALQQIFNEVLSK